MAFVTGDFGEGRSGSHLRGLNKSEEAPARAGEGRGLCCLSMQVSTGVVLLERHRLTVCLQIRAGSPQ